VGTQYQILLLLNKKLLPNQVYPEGNKFDQDKNMLRVLIVYLEEMQNIFCFEVFLIFN